MKILAFEFSSAQRSVAALQAGGHGRALAGSEVVEAAPRNTMKPLSMVEEVLRQTGWEREQIECIAIGLGPGSYTGIRAAIALAQGWQLGRTVRIIGVSSAECVAMRAQAEGGRGALSVVIDAQRQEFYRAGYELTADAIRETGALRLVKPEELAVHERAGGWLAGPEITRWFSSGQLVFPRAGTVAQLASKQTGPDMGGGIEPIYLRETTFVKAPPSRTLPGD